MTPLPPLAPELLARLDDFIGPLLCGLSSRRDRRVAHDHVHGLLGPGERKTVAPIAQRARGVESAPATEAWMRAMLNDPQWSHTEMISEGMSRLWEQSEGWAAITLDDTALLKKGTHSVAVHNQTCHWSRLSPTLACAGASSAITKRAKGSSGSTTMKDAPGTDSTTTSR